ISLMGRMATTAEYLGLYAAVVAYQKALSLLTGRDKNKVEIIPVLAVSKSDTSFSYSSFAASRIICVKRLFADYQAVLMDSVTGEVVSGSLFRQAAPEDWFYQCTASYRKSFLRVEVVNGQLVALERKHKIPAVQTPIKTESPLVDTAATAVDAYLSGSLAQSLNKGNFDNLLEVIQNDTPPAGIELEPNVGGEDDRRLGWMFVEKAAEGVVGSTVVATGGGGGVSTDEGVTAMVAFLEKPNQLFAVLSKLDLEYRQRAFPTIEKFLGSFYDGGVSALPIIDGHALSSLKLAVERMSKGPYTLLQQICIKAEKAADNIVDLVILAIVLSKGRSPFECQPLGSSKVKLQWRADAHSTKQLRVPVTPRQEDLDSLLRVIVTSVSSWQFSKLNWSDKISEGGVEGWRWEAWSIVGGGLERGGEEKAGKQAGISASNARIRGTKKVAVPDVAILRSADSRLESIATKFLNLVNSQTRKMATPTSLESSLSFGSNWIVGSRDDDTFEVKDKVEERNLTFSNLSIFDYVAFQYLMCLDYADVVLEGNAVIFSSEAEDGRLVYKLVGALSKSATEHPLPKEALQ
ncbi:hypothetical protein HDV05_006921, partial [Chytridiales sp. JEL 0842]